MPVSIAIVLEREEPKDELLIGLAVYLCLSKRADAVFEAWILAEVDDRVVEVLGQQSDRAIADLLGFKCVAAGIEALEHVVPKPAIAFLPQDLCTDEVALEFDLDRPGKIGVGESVQLLDDVAVAQLERVSNLPVDHQLPAEVKIRGDSLQPVDQLVDAFLEFKQVNGRQRQLEDQRLDKARLCPLAPAEQALEVRSDDELAALIHVHEFVE